MDIFKRFWWFLVPFLLSVFGVLGCKVTERIQFREYASVPPGIWYSKEQLLQTPEGVILERTTEFDPFAAVNVFVAFGEAVIEGAGSLVEGAGRLAGSLLRLIPGLADVFPEPPPPAPPGG